MWQNLAKQQIHQDQTKLQARDQIFNFFRVLHLIRKQVYKLKLLKRWRIYDIFYVSLIKYNTTKKEQVDKATSQLKLKDDDKSKEYEIEAIFNSTVYARESKSDYLPSLYYLVLWKSYSKEDNPWELVLVIQYLRRLLSTFHKKHPKKSTATLPPVNLTPPTTKPIVKHKSLNNKQKCD